MVPKMIPEPNGNLYGQVQKMLKAIKKILKSY